MRCTRHVTKRLSQRGLTNGAFELTEEYGIEMKGRLGFRKQEGREVLHELNYQLTFLDSRTKEGRMKARKLLKIRAQAKHLLSTGGCVVVYGDCGQVAITAYRYQPELVYKRKGYKKY